MHGFLSTAATAALAFLLPATSVSARPAASGDYPTCGSVSANPDLHWRVHGAHYLGSYTFSTPAHQIASGTVEFNVTTVPEIPGVAGSSGANMKMVCEAYSTQLSDFFYGNIEYNCTMAGGDDGDDDEEYAGPRMSFKFNTASAQLDLKEVWSCEDTGSQYTAMGSIDLDWQCEDKSWQNPDWEMGEIYSTRTVDCGPVSIDVPVGNVSVAA